MTAAGSLTVGRLHRRLLVPREHPQPDAAAARLDAVGRGRLEAALAQELGPLLAKDAPGVWLIRRLEASLTVDLSGQDEQETARLFGRQLAGAITRATAGTPDGRNVLYYADWASYAARFAADCAQGQAWGQWYYAPFEGLRALQAGQAVQEAILMRPEYVGEILARLAEHGTLERVLHALSESHARRLFQACLVAGSSHESSSTSLRELDVLLELWVKAGIRIEAGSGPAKNSLRLWAAWRRPSAHAPGRALSDAGLQAALSLLLAFARLLQGVRSRQKFIELLEGGAWSEAARLAQQDGQTTGLECLPQIVSLAEGEPGWLVRAAGILMPGAVEVRPGQRSSEAAVPCRFPGVFLLLPTLSDLGWHLLFDRHAPSEEPAAVLRYWLLLKCLGAPRWETSRVDPAVLAAAGLEALPSAEAERQASGIPGESLLELRRNYREVLLVQGRAAARLVALESVILPGERAAVVARDAGADIWLGIREITQKAERPEPPVVEGKSPGKDGLFSPVINLDEERLLLEEIAGHMDGPPEIVWRAGEPVMPELRRLAPEYLKKAKPAGEILAYFTLLGLPPELDHSLTLLAQSVLHTFARRMTGFAWSSPEHLYANFMAGGGLLETLNADRPGKTGSLTVRMEPPPLLTMLKMSGTGDQPFPVPWLGGLHSSVVFEESGR